MRSDWHSAFSATLSAGRCALLRTDGRLALLPRRPSSTPQQMRWAHGEDLGRSRRRAWSISACASWRHQDSGSRRTLVMASSCPRGVRAECIVEGVFVPPSPKQATLICPIPRESLCTTAVVLVHIHAPSTVDCGLDWCASAASCNGRGCAGLGSAAVATLVCSQPVVDCGGPLRPCASARD
jgi:hypothetical protein